MTHIYGSDYLGFVKTTVEITDALYAQARDLAHREGRSFRSVLEEALHTLIRERVQSRPYVYRDCSVGGRGLAPEWADRPLRELIHDTYERPLP